MYYLKKKHPGKRLGSSTIPGIFMEVKETEWYTSIYNVDMTQHVFNFLKFNNLETVEKCTAAGIPIMLQSYATEPMIRFATMTDLPRIQLLKSHYMPIDFEYIATYAHGVGVNSEFIMYWPNMHIHHLFAPSAKSALVEYCHSLGLSVISYKLA